MIQPKSTDTSTDTGTEARRRQAGRLLASLRDEVAAQERIAALLERQEQTVVSPSSDLFREATEALEAELGRAPHRATKRERVLRDLAELFGVARSALTITSLVERLGPAGDALRVERGRLESTVLEVQRRTRRVNALVRMHREVTRDLLQVVLGTEEGGDVHAGGTLIDAEV